MCTNRDMKKNIFFLILCLVVLSALMTGAGGLLDMLGQDHLGPVSKTHLWNDGLWLLGLALLLGVISR